MKRILLIIGMLWGVAYGQSTGYLRYDSVRMEKIGGNSELILLNGTRNVTGGVLTNLGNGRTSFVVGAPSNANAGSGFRWLLPGDQTIKTAINGYGIIWDSAVAGSLRAIADTGTLFPAVRTTIPPSALFARTDARNNTAAPMLFSGAAQDMTLDSLAFFQMNAAGSQFDMTNGFIVNTNPGGAYSGFLSSDNVGNLTFTGRNLAADTIVQINMEAQTGDIEISTPGKLFLKASGYGGASNGDVLSLIDNTTGEVGWATPSGGSGSNIYNADGILTGHRLLTGSEAAFGLTLDSLAHFVVTLYDGQIEMLSRDLATPTIQSGIMTSASGGVVIQSGTSTNSVNLNVDDDTAYIIYAPTAPSISSLTGYKLQARNISSGALVDVNDNVINAGEWHTTGNSGTVAGTNYVGTSDNVAFDFRTNATQAMRINTSQELLIGTTTDNGSYLFQVNGNMLTMGGFLSFGTAGSNVKLTPSGSSLQAVRIDNSDYATVGAKYFNATTGVYSGNISTVPSAWFHAAAGTATRAPFMLTSGTNLTTPAAGALEWNGTQLFLTSSTPTRHILAQVSGSTALTSGTTPVATTDGRLTDGLILAASTYTPTLTNLNNLDASTAYQCQYSRVGNTVTVSGRVDVDPTTAGVQVQLNVSLPIASDIGALNDVGGVGFAVDVAGQGGGIIGSASGNSAVLEFIAGDTTNKGMWFTFTYRII